MTQTARPTSQSAPESQPPTDALPLAGVRIIEMSTMVTASLSAQMLAEQGADVIKIEPQGIGDPMRMIGSQKLGLSALFHNCNRGKRSIALDLKDDQDLSVARRLCEGADVVMSNYRPGVLKRIGLGYAALSAVNPALVYARVSGFGQLGPMAELPAYDMVMQAQIGLADQQGRLPDGTGRPALVKQLVFDKVTALTTAQAVTAGLLKVARTGAGSRIDISMLDAGLYFMWPDVMVADTLLSDDATHLRPLGSSFATYETLDGFVSVAPIMDPQWLAVLRAQGSDDLINDPRYNTRAARAPHLDEFMAIVTGRVFPLTTAGVQAAMASADVPCAPCLTPRQAADHEQARANGTVEIVDHPYLGPVRSVRAAARFDGVTSRSHAPSPRLDEHGAEIRAELA